MSTLSVTTINTTNSTTDFTASTGNTTGSKIVVSSSNGMTFYANSTNTAAYVDANGTFATLNKLEVGSHGVGGFDFGSLALIEVDANQNTYVQIVAQNANSGNAASTDLVLTNDTGNDTVGFLDIGINSSTYNQAAFNIGAAGDSYIYTSNGSLSIGTASSGEDVVIHANGTTAASEKLRIGASGTIAVNGSLTVTGAANITANLNVTSNNLVFPGIANSQNGYCFLPSGLKMNWGRVAAANTAAGTFAQFTSAYTSGVWSITLGTISTTRTVAPLIISSNTTGANISSGLATTTGTSISYIAIGY